MIESFVRAFAAEPSRTRRPDVLFAAMGHFPGGVIPVGVLTFMPELIVEVRSPNDEVEEVRRGSTITWRTGPSWFGWCCRGGGRSGYTGRTGRSSGFARTTSLRGRACCRSFR
jgi:hypothetical protein